MIVAIHQPQFLPWLGYFNKMTGADAFCLLDTVQYKKNEWQNRNRIKTADGWQWLTVPVSFKFPEKIQEVLINNNTSWRKKHFQALTTNYRKAAYFDDTIGIFEDAYSREWTGLSELNTWLISALRKCLGIDGRMLVRSSDFEDLSDDPTMRLVDICKKLGGDTYLSGPDGPRYMDMDAFRRNGISVKIQEFCHPEYRQCFGPFQSHLSIVDLLFNCGPESYDIVSAQP